IPHELQEIIFDAFEQGDHVLDRSQRGFGLGLAISRRLVELLGGRISLESSRGAGSTFTVTLPLMEASAIVDARAEIDWSDVDPFTGKTVVVVDDDDKQRYLLRRFLEDLEIAVHE